MSIAIVEIEGYLPWKIENVTNYTLTQGRCTLELKDGTNVILNMDKISHIIVRSKFGEEEDKEEGPTKDI